MILLELLTGPQHTMHCKEYKTTHESLQKVKYKIQLKWIYITLGYLGGDSRNSRGAIQDHKRDKQQKRYKNIWAWCDSWSGCLQIPAVDIRYFFLILSSEWYSIFCNILVFSNRRVTGSHHSTRGLDKKSINHDKRCFCGRISLGKQLHCYPDANEWLRWRVLVHGESEWRQWNHHSQRTIQRRGNLKFKFQIYLKKTPNNDLVWISAYNKCKINISWFNGRISK